MDNSTARTIKRARARVIAMCRKAIREAGLPADKQFTVENVMSMARAEFPIDKYVIFVRNGLSCYWAEIRSREEGRSIKQAMYDGSLMGSGDGDDMRVALSIALLMALESKPRE